MERAMSKWNVITPATIHQIACEVRDGEADPDDARRLIAHFCDCLDKGESIPHELVKHFQNAFRAYLDGGRTLESALGLVRKKGRPKADEGTRQEMAAEVLRLRLKGMSHQESLESVSEKFGWSSTIIGEAWCTHKFEAVCIVRNERPLDQYPWTSQEVDQLSTMFDCEN
jgi:hypothetical protein